MGWIHGDENSCVWGSAQSVAPKSAQQKAIDAAKLKYNSIVSKKEAAIESLMTFVKPVSKKAEAWAERNEFAHQGMLSYPKWVVEEYQRVEKEQEIALEEATEKWLDSDDSEFILEQLIAAKLELDSAIAVLEDTNKKLDNEKKEKIKDAIEVLEKGWFMICLDSNEVKEVLSQCGNNYKSQVVDLVGATMMVLDRKIKKGSMVTVWNENTLDLNGDSMMYIKSVL